MRVEPDCWRCERRNDSVQVVWPTIVRDAKICVIGEYPGFSEDKAGVTFCGRPGGMLREAIAKVGMDPAKDVSYANAVFCFGGRKKTKVKRQQVEACSRHMWRAIRAAYMAGTRVFVCAGATACEAVMGHEVKVSQVNGDRTIAKPPMSAWNAVALEDFCYDRDITLPMEHDGIPPALIEDSGFVSSAFMQRMVETGFAYEEPPDLQVVPTYNPNYFIQSGVGEEYKMEKALRSAYYWAEDKEPEKHEKNYKAIFDADEAIQYIDSIIDRYENGVIEFFALDYETVGPPENMVKGALNPFLPGGRILTINLSHMAHFARVIYLTHPASTMTVSEQAAVAKKMRELLEKVPVAGANIRFDLHWSRYKLGARKWTIAHDTQLMNYAVFLGLRPNDLKTLVSAHIEGDADYEADLKEFLNALPREERHYANIPEDKMTLYGSHDVDVIHQLVPILTDQLKDHNQYEQYQLFLIHPYPAFIEMEQNGAFIHNEMVSELLVEYTRRVEEPAERFKTDPEFAAYWNKWMMYKIKLAQEKRAAYKSERHKKKKIQPKELDINFGSAQQVAVLLFSIAGLPTWGDKGQKTKKLEKIFPNGIPTTKDEALENIRELVADQDGPAVKLLDLVMEHRTDSKILSTYLKKAYENCPVPHEKPDWWDTRHTLNDPRRYEAELYDIGAQSASFNLTSTRTGRTSSDGPNIQQVTKKMRRMYVPRPVPPEDELLAMGLDPKLNTRRLIANFDVGQAELRMLAVACQDPTMLAIMSDPKRDIHREIAAVAYNKPISAITSTERTSVKRIVFGTAYGRSARAVAAQLKIPIEEAESIQTALFAMMPGAKGWINDRHLEADMSGEVVTPTGRVRNLSMHQNSGERHRRAVNTPIQGGASDLTLWATGWIHKWMQENKVNSILWNFVHDSINFDVYPQEAEMLMRVCRHYFSVATPQQFPWYNVPLVLEFEFGTDWEKQVACEYVDDTREVKFEGKPDRVTNVFRTFKPLLTDIVLDPEWTKKAGRKDKDGLADPADVWVSAKFY